MAASMPHAIPWMTPPRGSSEGVKDRQAKATAPQGRLSEAGGLLRGVPAMNRGEALCALTGILRATGATGESGEAAFGAFGLARTDVEAWRFLMNFFMGQREYEPALRMASQLLRVSPSDRGARAVVRWIRGFPKWDAVTIAPTDPGAAVGGR